MLQRFIYNVCIIDYPFLRGVMFRVNLEMILFTAKRQLCIPAEELYLSRELDDIHPMLYPMNARRLLKSPISHCKKAKKSTFD